nr:ribosomal protein S18-alanine N-acetyltransferase [Ignicoccus islandicus]
MYEIEKRSFDHPYPPQVLLSHIILHYDTSIVALIGDEIVGYAFSAVEVKRGKRCIHLLNIAVDPKFQGIGIGKAMLERIVEIACEKGIDCIVLEVSVANQRAIKFYEANGFKKVDLLKNYYPWGEDAYLMIRNIVKCRA